MFNSRIYSAVYSGVSVFEMIVNGIAVMRRQKDSYMNATQILKVANIDKGKRTRILEKEVLTGEYEKVQGGYGKYQGTWIPFYKSKELAEKYNVLQALGPLLEFDVNTGASVENLKSLPTKEQANVALRQSPKKIGVAYQQPFHAPPPPADPSVDQTAFTDQQRLQRQQTHFESQVHLPYDPRQGTIPMGYLPPPSQNNFPPPQNAHSSSTQYTHPPQTNETPPTLSNPHHTPVSRPPAYDEENEKLLARKKAKVSHLTQPTQGTETESQNETEDENNRGVLMSIFLSDNPDRVFELLHNGRMLPNIDMIIDESGSTALHWAASLARTNLVQRLVERKANVSCVNYGGETPLMRTVLVTNSFENKSFPQILDLLANSLTILDNKRRSVLHHACLAAGVSDRMEAAAYYVDTLLKMILKSEKYKYIIDLQDSLGDTATTIAARLNNNTIMDLLLKAGATKITENNVGLVSDDYEEEKIQDFNNCPKDEQNKSTQSDPFLLTKKIHGPSQRGKEIVATVQKIVDALDNEYGTQLESKEQQLNAIQEDLDIITRELESTRKEVEKRQVQSQKLSEAQQKTLNVENALEVGWARLQKIMEEAGGKMPDRSEIDNFDENEDIDKLFIVDNVELPNDASEDEKKYHMQKRVQRMQAVIKAYKINDGLLQHEIEEIQAKFAEKEMQCKRLIAACCNLPIEKIDDLVEPLTLAIESDPPDLDLARVIGFMDKVKRQGTFPDAPISSNLSPIRTTTRDSPGLPSDADTPPES